MTTMTRTCGIHGDDTSSGRCATCDREREPAVYAVVVEVRDGAELPARLEWVEAWPRDDDGSGVITATTRAAYLSARGGPHEVHRPDGRLLARYVGGRRADLPPGGIVRLANERAAVGL